ncbi:MAG TPA: sigma-54-dependent Fis family transcriptional regulator [Polyangia bacterium]|nr:sigma-54-dependent Fis family transcriptional regulator [Polyangia bacterium]
MRGLEGAADPEADIDHIRRERDLYRALLDLGVADKIETFLEQALSLIVTVTGARRGYIELTDETSGQPRWYCAHDCSGDQLQAIRSAFSRGVIAEALATGKTVATASALDDPRFRDLGSVRKNRIEAVLCAPIGAAPPMGILYLQDRLQPGPFTEEDRQDAEVFARHLATLADRILIRQRQSVETDPTTEFRRTLHVEGVIGRSPAMANVLRHVSLVAPIDVSVLITGPSGTGKTQLARVIHENGPRARNPFVELNCAALPETLIESELFGAVPGAHSTASRRVEGKVASAEGGTLFLDEIGELPLPAQSKLLQLLHSKEYFPLGSPRPVRADIRIIAATNSDLKKTVADKVFREDLFYRLQVLPVRMPSLAERREDIPQLLMYFCARARASHQLPELRLSVGATQAALAAEWPGNLRELAHAVEAAAIRAAAQGVLTIERSHLFPDLEPSESEAHGAMTFQQATRLFQGELLRRTLEETGWNVVDAANRLDLARSHIYNLIRAHGIERKPG